MSAHPEASMQRVRLRYGRSPTHVRGRAREGLRGAIRWLNPRAPDVVRVQRTAALPGPGDASVENRSIRRQLARWRGRVRRARGAVVLRRYLALALGLAVLGEVIARVASSETRPLWAFVGVAAALAGALVVLAAPITDATVAEMLDRGLGLYDTVGTGLELEARTKGSPMLAAHVIAEAHGALRSSLGTARARPRPAGREWSALLAMAFVLALLVALPKFGHGQSLNASRTHHAGGSTVGKVRHRGSAAQRLHRRHHASLPVGADVNNNYAQPPLAISQSSQQTGKGLGTSIYGHGAKSTGNYQIAHTGLSESAAGTRLVGAPGSADVKPSSNRGGQGSQGAGSAGAKPAGGASPGGRLSPPGARGASQGAVRAGGRGAGAPAAHGGHAAGEGSQSGQSHSRSAPPGGEKAGASRGSTQRGPALAPDLASGHAGLPLQAGFAPSAAGKARHGGTSQTPNGGGGRARSEAAGGAAGGGGQSGATPIQPTPNTGAVGTQSLVSSYFGGANQLRPGSW